MFDTISIGSATLDIFMKSKQFVVVPAKEGVEGPAALCQPYGGKIDVDAFFMQSGGGATNTAVAFSRLGLQAAVIAEMGDDLAAKAIHHELQAENVDMHGLVVEPTEQTAVSALLIASDGDRTAITARGASRELTVEDVRWPELQSNWIHISSLGDRELLRRVVQHCRDHRIHFSWNPGGVELAMLAKGELHPNEVYPYILCLNKEEAERITTAGYELETAGEQVIVTDGARGGRYCEHGEWHDFSPSKSTKVVQLTGAGDAFISGVVAASLHDRLLPEAIRWGTICAGSVITHMGAKTGLPTLEQLETQL
jgi:ribokinase